MIRFSKAGWYSGIHLGHCLVIWAGDERSLFNLGPDVLWVGGPFDRIEEAREQGFRSEGFLAALAVVADLLRARIDGVNAEQLAMSAHHVLQASVDPRAKYFACSWEQVPAHQQAIKREIAGVVARRVLGEATEALAHISPAIMARKIDGGQ